MTFNPKSKQNESLGGGGSQVGYSKREEGERGPESHMGQWVILCANLIEIPRYLVKFILGFGDEFRFYINK